MGENGARLKSMAALELERLQEEMADISGKIHALHEVGHQEFESAKLLMNFLSRYGFEVKSGIAGMETAFLAVPPHRSAGPTVALLAEYDALPGIGHGCGHNLIGTAAAGAAAAVRMLKGELQGGVRVIGCPAEEAGVDNAGGKALLIKGGYFDGVDAALLFHPMPLTMVGGETTALVGLEFTFTGRAAHAAGNPWDGINALDGVLLTYNGINALRQHVRDNVRIHGIVTMGGDAPNIVPDKAAARFFLRAGDLAYLKELVRKVENCAKGAALATGAELVVRTFNNIYEPMKSNPVLAEVLTRNLILEGLSVEGVKKGKGSTDFGNVSRVVPSCELDIRLGDGIVPHTGEFARAANSDEGNRVMMRGARILAASVIDLLTSPSLLADAKARFKAGRV